MSSKRPKGESPTLQVAESPAEDGKRNSRQVPRGEWIMYIILAAMAAGFLIGSFEYSDPVQRWPLILSCTIIGLTVVYAAYRLRTGTVLHASVDDQQSQQLEDSDQTQNTAVSKVRQSSDGKIFVASVLLVLFGILAYGLGFLISVPVFAATYMFTTGYRKPLIMIGVVLGITLPIYLLFGSTLNVPVTEGAWLEYDLSWLPLYMIQDD